VIPHTDDGGACATAVDEPPFHTDGPAADDPDICTRCGACCAHFRVSFYWAEGEALPEALTVKLNPHMSCMAGTDHPHRPRCAALAGHVGCAVRCTAYDDRPSPCHELQPGEDKCQRARARHGLPPLRMPEMVITTHAHPVVEIAVDAASSTSTGPATPPGAMAETTLTVVATHVGAGAATIGPADASASIGADAAPAAVQIVTVEPVTTARQDASNALPADLTPDVAPAPDDPAPGRPIGR